MGREDRALTVLRQVLELVEKLSSSDSLGLGGLEEVLIKVAGLVKEFSELVFKEDKVLFPATWALLSEGEWVAISEIVDEMDWLVDVSGRKWEPTAKPVLPYELEVRMSDSDVEKLLRNLEQPPWRVGVEPDAYKIASEGGLNLGSGFLSPE